MKSKMKRILAFLCAVVLVATTVLGNWYTEPEVVEAADSVEPVSVDGFENVTIKDFVDSSGSQMPEQTYSDLSNGNGTLTSYSLASGANLNGKLVSMKVKFTGGGGNARLDVGGIGDWSGFSLYANSSSNYMHIYTNYDWSSPAQGFDIDASKAGLTSVLDTEFILQMSIKYIDGDTDSVEVGVYINGILCNTCTITGVSPEKFGGYLGVYCQDTGRTITVSSVEWPPEPVQLKGFENLTISDFTDSNGYSMKEGIYTAGTGTYSVSRLKNLDKTLFSTRITFHSGIESSHESSLMIGGAGQWQTLNICTSADGKYLYLEDTWSSSVSNSWPNGAIAMDAEIAGVQSFVDDEFLLQLSFEYGEADANGKADFTIGVYIEGKLYNNQKITVEDWDMNHAGPNLWVYYEKGGMTLKNVNIRQEPIVVDGFDNITIADFTDKSDGTGNVLEAGTYTGTYCYPYYLSDETNFEGKLLSMYVTFGGGGSYKNSITIAGTSSYDSFNIHPNSDIGTELVFNTSPWGGNITSNSGVSITASDADVSSFVNNEFLLQISFSYGTETNGYADLTLGFYIDGKECGTKTIASCNMNKAGTNLSLIPENDTDVVRSITVDNVEFDKFAGYTEVTVEDFVDGSGNVMEEKAYTTTEVGAYDVYSLKDYDDFDKKKLALNVMFKHGGGGTRIDLAGAGEWNGVSMWTNETGSYLYVGSNYGDVSSGTPEFPINISKDSVGISSFLDTKFLLEMTFKYVSDTQIEIGVYVNGVLANNQKYTLTVNDMTKFGDYIGFYREADESAILIGSVNSDSFPVDMGIQPSYRYEKLTFGHFGILDKKYPHIASNFAVYGNAIGRDTLDKTVICGDILLEGDKQFQVIWGGKDDAWNGLRMFTTADSMSLTWYYGSSTKSVGTLNSATAGVSFVGETYNIMLSAELVNHNGGESAEVDDIKIGIWFNGVLYNQEYFYVDDEGANLGNYFGVYCGDGADGSFATLGNITDLLEQPDESFEWITYDVFGIDDGRYDQISGDFAVKGTYKRTDTLDKTVVCGDVFLSETGNFQYIVGGEKHWDGLRFMIDSADSMNLSWFTGTTETLVTTFQAATAGVKFKDEKFNLMMSFEVVDADGDGGSDIKLGVWFNGFLYGNDYVTIPDKGTILGGTIGVYCEKPGDYAILNSIPEYIQMPDKSFDRITFSDFGLETQKYDLNGDVAATGTTDRYSILDRVVFSGDFRFSATGDYQIIYGGDGGWDGLRFIIDSNGNLNVRWYESDEKVDGVENSDNRYVAYVTPELAGLTSFTKQAFNLMISTELVDDDGDGNKNDIRIGMWFDGVRYAYEGRGYQIVKDWGKYLQNGFGIYGATDKHVLLRNVAEYQANPYYYEDISPYRGETYTAPTLEGYVFGGWYADEEYTEWIGTDVTSGAAWAKFVEEDVLTVKPQIKVNDEGSVPTDETSLRLVTTVDGLEYSKLSFYLQKEKDGSYGNEVDAATLSNEDAKMVYEKLYYIGSNAETMEYKPNVFSWQSEYFKAFTLTGIPGSDYGVMIKATPFWVTLDGTTVRGEALETCVDYYKPSSSDQQSVAASIDFLGEETMPITGYNGPYPASNETDAMLYPDYVTDEYFKLIADSGVNVIISSNMDYKTYPDLVKKALILGEKYGIGIYVQDSTILDLTTKEEIKAQISNYSGYQSFAGMYLVDEPGTESYKSDATHGLASKYKDVADALNELGILTYVNLFPIVDTTDKTIIEGIFGDQGIRDEDKKNYEAYVTEVHDTLKPAVLMWDFYPFAGEEDVDMSLYFYNMNAIRSKAQSVDKPFWAFVQAGGQWNDNHNNYFTSDEYYPSKGEFNWNVNTSLAFGAQGIQYFPLVQPYHFANAGSSAANAEWDFYRNGFIGAWGNKTQWYGYAQAINEHIGEIDSVLMNSVNQGVIATGNAATATSGLSSILSSSVYGSYKLKSVPDNVMIGCFDYRGKTALYVVNYDYDNAQNVTLEFTETYDVKVSQNAETTRNYNVTGLTLDMAAGEGILLVIE